MSSTHWQLSEKVDIFEPVLNRWLYGMIIHLNKSNGRICVKYDEAFTQTQIHPSFTSFTWIDNTSDRIRKLNTFTTAITVLPSISRELFVHVTHPWEGRNQLLPVPLFCELLNKIIISDELTGVYYYDINGPEPDVLLRGTCYRQLCKYPSQYKHQIRHPQHVLDEQKQMLHIFNFGTRCNFFATFDLKSNVWKRQNIEPNEDNMIYCGFFTININRNNAVFLKEYNEIHVITHNNHHIKYDINRNVLTQLNAVVTGKMAYVESMQKLFLFGDMDHEIYFCEIKNKDQTEYEWKQCSINMPISDKIVNHDVVIAFDHIAVVYYVDEYRHIYDIYCVDLLYGTVFKSDKKLPFHLRLQSEQFHLLLCDNVVYLYYGSGDTCIHHCRWALNPVVPQELKRLYRSKKDDPLVFGFVKESETQEHLFSVIPFCISKLILTFYPSHFDDYKFTFK